MSEEKQRQPGPCERATRRVDRFVQWIARRCGEPLRHIVKVVVEIIETVVETVVNVVKTTVEYVSRSQTVKTIVDGAEAVDKALHLGEWLGRVMWLVTWLSGSVKQIFCAAQGASTWASALLCNNGYSVALAAVVMASLFILYFLGTVMRA